MQTNLNLSSHKTIIMTLLVFVLLTGFTVPILYNHYETQKQNRYQTELNAQQLQEQKLQQAIRDQQIEDAARGIQYKAEQESYLRGNTAYADKDYLQAIEFYKKITSENPDYQTAQDQIEKSVTEMYAHYLAKAGFESKQGNNQEAIRLLTDMSAYFPDDVQIKNDLQKYQKAQEAEKTLVPYKGPIEHIFFHPLLAYPALTFDGDADSNGFNQYFVTVSEFKKILNQIYANNYIMVNVNALYEEKVEDGKTVLVRKELKLPLNKKPLILSVDDVNYPDYKSTNGTISKLILDSDGNVATYSVSPSGEKVISHDNEIIPMIDAFVAEHPDFSFQGAKGILALTGYYGILGYNTNKLDSPSYPEERQTALMIIERLKETGWTFASHGYSHLDARAESYQSLEKDTLRWRKEVESLIGPTNIYIYPFGSSVLPGNPKFQFLLDQGFNILCSVGPTPYLKDSTDYVMMDRRHIDGIALYNQAEILKNLFDAKSVLDPVRPPLKTGS
ncbi:polysaccharide deacetylase family protein [Desulfosporosinus shakirovi]|uniref:polysaccharide deacetylase family protein n=1 Tax=Desulfosporosinus shakirovi TaxID=2885154 RepID=UPI001E295D3E|nr:polysaccharide deacetylase family protein [Desulfosporosinus sp. SRJS8]MCB8817867.1 polysaccharide deacetylase family protein [Desulfosporosinus sp. SRJS8]